MRDPSRRFVPGLAAAALAGGLTIALPAGATTEEKLLDPDGAPEDRFGWSVDIDGSRAIVGAPFSAAAGAEAGKAIVFHHDGTQWQVVATLFPVVSPAGSRFGTAVAIDGDTAVVGAPYQGGGFPTGAGRAYVYHWNGTAWAPQAVLEQGAPGLGDRFGAALDVAGPRLVVGAPGEDLWAEDTGAVYAFTESGGSWLSTQLLVNLGLQAFDFFGMSVSLWSARLMIGAGQFDATAVRSGAAFFYELEAGSWVQGPEIGPPGSDGFDQFGISVGLYGNQALAGANLEEPQPGFSGAAYFWNRMPILGSWSLAKKYIVPDTGNPFAPDDFGYAVALADLLAVVSSPDADGLAPSSGVVHALGRVNGKWHPSATLFASDGSEAQSFGWSLATTDACALVGAPGDDDNGAFSGAAYVYCGLPPPVVLTDLQVICCENVPSIGSVLIQIGWSTPGLAAVQATRRVLLYRPDGSFEEVAARAPIEIEPGAQAQEQIEHALPAGFFGPFAIVVEWEDANGSHSETALFSHAPAGVPGLAPGALGLLALALLTTGAGLYSAHGAARRRVRLSLRRMGV